MSEPATKSTELKALEEQVKQLSSQVQDCELTIEDLQENGRCIQTPPQVLVKKLRDDARMPEFATDGSACFDFFALADMGVDGHGAHLPTGLSFAIPEGWAMLIYSRSGHGFKKGVRLVNCVGVIDSDYRGEVQIGLVCDRDGSSHQVKAGDRIAQGMLVPVLGVNFVEADELPNTERGTGGFGSTGG